jgi:FixJ family two-component response regulator
VDDALPAMIGTDVIAAARHARPDLAVVLMTGYANTDALGERLQGVELLKKPFRRQELAAALEGALRRRRRVAGGGNVVRLEPPRR